MSQISVLQTGEIQVENDFRSWSCSRKEETYAVSSRDAKKKP